MNGRKSPAVLPMRVQKQAFPPCSFESVRLPRSSPEAEGVDPACLERYVAAAAADKTNNLHGITVLRHGKVIYEKSFLPYDRNVWHVTHSLCKTVTSLAVGICIGEEILHIEDRVVDYFPDRYTASWYQNLTLYHLLTMTSGVSYNEVCSVTEQDWLRGFLRSRPLFSVGEKFHYNSMNSYVLSAIISAATGKSLSAFLRERLFEPMGINRFYWETCPCGIEKGGWGLYLLQEDAAKLGQLILNRGVWNGQQLVPKDYIHDMCLWHSDPPAGLSRNGYGYHCWLWEREGSVQFSGLFGQTVLVVPDKDIVLSVNAGAKVMLGEAKYMRTISAFLEEGIIEESCALKSTTALHETERDPVFRTQRSCGRSGRTVCYKIRKGRARLLPAFIQVSENNYSQGIDQISVSREGARLYISFSEGKTLNRVEVGFASPAVSRITSNGEVYLAACSGKWGRKGNAPRLSLQLCFLEHASTRYIDLTFEEEQLLCVKLYESPGRTALLEGLSLLLDDERTVRLLSRGRTAAYFQRLCEPELHGVRIEKSGTRS